MHVFQDESENKPLIRIILKIICAPIVCGEASKQNKNKYLWFILGVIEYHAALLVLMRSKTILKVEKSKDENIQKANEEYIAKIKTLAELKNSGILNDEELKIKKGEIQNEYIQKIDRIRELAMANAKEKTEAELFEKLKQAYNSGIITQKEFEEKFLSLVDSEKDKEFKRE